MKCPKCGYNSFEYLDSCKKCNNDLSGFKATHGIRAIVLPLRQSDHPFSAPEDTAPDFSIDVSGGGEDSGTFGWHEPGQPADAARESFPSLELDLPEPEPEPFSFDLDLPSDLPPDLPSAEPEEARPEEPYRQFTLDDLGGDGAAFGEPDTPPAPAPSEETAEKAFDDLSFDDLYREEQQSSSPAPEVAQSVPDDPFREEPAPAMTDGPGEFSFDDLQPETPLPAAEEASTPPAEPPNPFSFDEFSFDEEEAEESAEAAPEAETAADETAADEDEVDTMGLSIEEYEALFGELPARKKPKPAA